VSKLIDLTGKKFGRLVVIKRVENDKWGHHKWLVARKGNNYACKKTETEQMNG